MSFYYEAGGYLYARQSPTKGEIFSISADPSGELEIGIKWLQRGS
jgi:hypothetical protein